ncbi:MAG: hypothetical protein EZS28_018891 [Streblomastix strix]|uniref:ShKT domain-containing protein n=1 Tax=Streblomastix strix TaxID=222440 RepID=A0A5J4VSL6_9EUKA|nr:MAG: hypothetical protein EZS28_018891 [Streblomastix strix]
MKVSLILIMVYTVLRMAEVQRAELRIENANQGEIVIATMTMKKPRGPVEKTLKAVQDRIVCLMTWKQSWLDKREVKGELKKEQVWRNKRKEKVWSADKCSKGVKCLLFKLCPNKQRSSHQRKDCDIIRPQGGLCITFCRQCELTCFPPRTNIRSHIINNYIVEMRLNRVQLQPHGDPSTCRMAIITITSSNNNKQCNNNDDASSNSNQDNQQCNNNDDANNNNSDKIEQE